MATADIEWFLELLSTLGPVRGRRMFGGWGLYAGDRMVALVADDQLYLKTDSETRPAFEQAGGRPFVYRSQGREAAMSYWSPPLDALDDPEAMRGWARLAQAAAERAPLPARLRKRRSPLTKVFDDQ